MPTSRTATLWGSSMMIDIHGFHSGERPPGRVVGCAVNVGDYGAAG
jgi:hypothetical protein